MILCTDGFCARETTPHLSLKYHGVGRGGGQAFLERSLSWPVKETRVINAFLKYYAVALKKTPPLIPHIVSFKEKWFVERGNGFS